MVGRVLRPLISFDLIFNRQIGLMRFLRDYCVDERYFDIKKLKGMSDGEMLSLILSNESTNPLDIILKYPHYEERDKLYEHFRNTYANEIVQNAPYTDFGNSVIMMAGNYFDAIKPFILVDSQDCIDKIRSVRYFSTVPLVMKDNNAINKMKSIQYDPIYVEWIDDLLFFDEKVYKTILSGKSIYVKDCAHNKNMIDKEPMIDSLYQLIQTCTITYISLWKKGEENNE